MMRRTHYLYESKSMILFLYITLLDQKTRFEVKLKSTTPGLPKWSPTLVLPRPDDV